MSRNLNPRRNKQAGFVLLEVLIAAVLATVTLIVVFHAYSTAFDGSKRTERVTIALLTAESKLAELSGAPLRAGSSNGRLNGGYEWGGYEWRAEVRALPGVGAERLPVVAYAVEVTVSWGSGASQAITLNSLSLGHEQTR